ncbi:MAG: MFS transporter [Novipirellula sp. JB048]
MFASFLTLVASGIGFATRTAAGGPWEREFNLGGGDFGAILGAGFLGFGLMIFFGGILVEKFGYKKLLMLAFVMHLVSAALLFAANPLFEGWRESSPENASRYVFNVLFGSAFLFSICQGLYEAVINPLIAQLYPDEKTHYLNILHAGWPAGMIVGGLFAAGFIGEHSWFVELPWQYALASFLVVVLAYGAMVIPERFPETVGETSASFTNVFSCFTSAAFLVLIGLHALIGYMELGIDSWMTKLMENLFPNSILILVYTSFLMFALRFFAGPIVRKINPIGLLLISSVIACLGLIWLGSPTQSVLMIFVAATFYSLGKAFLWPTMLGVAGERYPQSGSVAMGALGAAGMLCVGQIGGPRIGAQQGFEMSEKLKIEAPDTFARYASPQPVSSWGYEFRPLDAAKLNAANGIEIVDGKPAEVDEIATAKLIPTQEKSTLIAHANEDVPAVQAAYLYGGRRALHLTAYIPAIMVIGFLGLLVYFRAIGGYQPIVLATDQPTPVPEQAPTAEM